MMAILNGTVAEVLGILGAAFITICLVLGMMALILGSGRARKIGIGLGTFGIVGLIGTIYTNVSGTSLFGIIDWDKVALLTALSHIGAALAGGGIALGIFFAMMAMRR